MGVDYILEHDSCKVKPALGGEGIGGLVKCKQQAETILDAARASGSNASPAQMRVLSVFQTPHGTEQKEVTVQYLLDRGAELEKHKALCAGCRASLSRTSFGCYGRIGYPISAAAEEWLMSLLPEDIESSAGILLRKAVKDFQYDGRPIAKLRRQKTFFENGRPARKTWGKWLSKWEVSSDQILHMMFCVGPVQPDHAAMLSFFLGLIPHDSILETMMTPHLRNEVLKKARLNIHGGDEKVKELAMFVVALRAAAMLDVSLAVDY